MIADFLHDATLTDLVVMGVAIVGATAYALSTWRGGRVKGAMDALSVAQGELTVLRDQNERLEHDLNAARAEIARVSGTVDQLRDENASLRQLVMGDVVPPALRGAMEAVGQAASAHLLEALDGRLHSIEQGVARLLTEGR